MKEKILETFSDLGFNMTQTSDDNAYSFSYEGLNMLYMYNANDEDFLSISVPGIFEVNDNNIAHALALVDRINGMLKYIKAYILGSDVWLFYEHELFGGEDLMKVLPGMIVQLESAVRHSRKLMAEIMETMGGGDDCGDNAEAVEVEQTDEADDDKNE
ncbi:MAG: hypothetical protein ACI3Y5_08630 [Prevotella sp.]